MLKESGLIEIPLCLSLRITKPHHKMLFNILSLDVKLNGNRMLESCIISHHWIISTKIKGKLVIFQRWRVFNFSCFSISSLECIFFVKPFTVTVHDGWNHLQAGGQLLVWKAWIFGANRELFQASDARQLKVAFIFCMDEVRLLEIGVLPTLEWTWKCLGWVISTKGPTVLEIFG